MRRLDFIARQLLCVVSVLCCSGSAVRGTDDVVSVVLADFESTDELNRWELGPTLTPMAWELEATHVRHGQGSAKLTTPSVSEGGVSQDDTYMGRGWPAVVLPAEAMVEADWAPYRQLVFELFNPGPITVPLWVRFGDHQKFESVIAEQGWQTVRLDIDHITTLDELRFFFADPVYTSTIYLDHLRLETGDLSDLHELVEEAAVFISGVEQEPRARHVGSSLVEVRTELSSLAESWPDIAKDDLGGWSRQVRGIKDRLLRLVTRAQGDRFAIDVGDRRWGYGWIDGVTKVLRDAEQIPFPGEIGGTPTLSLAANETEGVQLVLRFAGVPADRALQNVRVSVSDLIGPEGARITSSQVEVLPVGYVNARKPPYHVIHVGWWPDPLLNFLDGFELDPKVWQPVWLDVRTTPEQEPGLYKGSITVSTDGNGHRNPDDIEVPFEVEVWDFALPVEHHFPLSLTYWPQSTGGFYFEDHADLESMLRAAGGEIPASELGNGAAKRVYDVHEKSVELVLAHRMFPDDIFRYRKTPPLDWVKLWHQRGARRFVLLAVQAYGSLPREEPYPAGRRKVLFDALAKGVPLFEKAGLLDMGYIFTFDEVGENRFDSIKDIHGEIKRLYPTIPLMTTAYDDSYGMDSGLDPYVDIWVPGINVYNQTTPAIAAARERGREIWWYITAGPDHPYPNILIEGPAVDHRLLMGFIPYKLKSDGFLYWCLNQWTETVTRGPLTNARGKAVGSYNGAGIVFYPGPAGPVPSIRMKNMRDGLEDFEYLWLLEQAVAAARRGEVDLPAAWQRRAETALEIDVVRSVSDYNRDPGALIAARRELAELLAQAAR